MIKFLKIKQSAVLNSALITMSCVKLSQLLFLISISTGDDLHEDVLIRSFMTS